MISKVTALEVTPQRQFHRKGNQERYVNLLMVDG
jgi:hypothetical protein